MAKGLICMQTDCDQARYARKFCENHYRQFLRGINPKKRRPYNGVPIEHLGDDIATLTRNLYAMESMMEKASAQLKQIAKRVAYTREHLPDVRPTTD